MSSWDVFHAHIPLIIDVVGLGFGLSLTVLSSETLVKGYYSPIFANVFAALVITHLLFPHTRRSSVLYVTLFIVGIVSILYYLLEFVKHQCGYGVLIGHPREVIPTVPEDPYVPDLCLDCQTVAEAWWSNVILTLYVDFMFVVTLLRKRYAATGRIRLPEDADVGVAPENPTA